MILIDTSIWIEYFRGKDYKISKHVDILIDNELAFICLPVKLELVNGVLNKEQKKLADLLSYLPYPASPDIRWAEIERNISIARKKGKRFGLLDLIIASIAEQSNLIIWSKDNDFKEMSSIGIVRIWTP